MELDAITMVNKPKVDGKYGNSQMTMSINLCERRTDILIFTFAWDLIESVLFIKRRMLTEPVMQEQHDAIIRTSPFAGVNSHAACRRITISNFNDNPAENR